MNKVDLPAPLAPTSATASPTAYRDGYAAERRDRPVSHVQAFDFEKLAHDGSVNASSGRFGAEPEISLDHGRFAPNLVRQTRRDDLAAIETDQAFGQRREKHEIVLDDKHGDAVGAEGADAVREIALLLFVESCRRFVKKEDPRAGCERARDLDTPARAIWQAAARLHRDISDAQSVRGGRRDPARIVEAAIAPQHDDRLNESSAVEACSCHGDIVEHRKVIDEMDVLESARHAQSCNRVGLAARNVVSKKRHTALVARIKSRDDVQQSRLAGSVGADEADDFALLAGKTNTVEGLNAAERECDIVDSQQRLLLFGKRSCVRGADRRRCGRHCPRWRAIGSEQERPQTLHCPDKPVRRQDQHGERGGSVSDHVIVFEHPETLAQINDQAGAQYGTGDLGASADHRHGQTGHHQREIEILRRDDVDHMRHQRAGGAAIGGTEDESAEPQFGDVQAQRRGGLAVFAHEMVGLAVESASHLIGDQTADGDNAPHEPQDRAAVGNGEARQLDGGNAGEAVGAAGDVAPLDGKQQHDEADTERGKRKIVFFKLEHRHRDDHGQQRRPGNRQRKRDQERKAEAGGENAGDIAADAKEGGLCKRDCAGVSEHELIAQHKKGINAAQREHAQIVGTSEKNRIRDQRRGADNQRQPYAREKPRRQAQRQAQGLLAWFRPGAEQVRRRCPADGRRK